MAKLDDVLEVYERPPNPREPVVCLDEKPVFLHKDIHPLLEPQRAGEILKRDYEYERAGTANVFCGVEPKTGRRFTRYTPEPGSRLNQAGMAICIYSRRCLVKWRIGEINQLRTETGDWNKAADRNPTPVQWKFTVSTARKKFHYKRPLSGVSEDMDFADPQTLAAEMLAQRQIAALSTSSDQALAPVDGPRWKSHRSAHAAIGHMCWGS